MSEFERGSSPRLSMREKLLLKRRVNKEHNSNFRAGYVNVNEEQLHKTGIRGRKRYVVCIVTTLLAITVVVNILITVCILAVLGIGRDGMDSLEFIPRSKLLRFLGATEMEDINLVDPMVGSLPEAALALNGEAGGKVELKVDRKMGSKVTVNPSQTVLQTHEGFEVRDPDTGAIVFSTDPDKLKELTEKIKSVNHLRAEEVVTDRVTSDTKEPLRLDSTQKMIMQGAEGVSATGRAINITANDDIKLWSTEDIILGGDSAMRLSFNKGLPVKDPSAPPREDVLTYKLCVGSPEGTVYSVPWNSKCA